MSAVEIRLSIGGQSAEAFFYDGFFTPSVASSPFHRHQFCEIHFTELGEAVFCMPDREILSHAGTVTAIPAGTVHRLVLPDKNLSHRAFLLHYPIKEIRQAQVHKDILSDFFAQADVYGKTRDPGKLAAYASFLCKDIVEEQPQPIPVQNRGFLIDEFFANNYNRSICLRDLAQLLCVSEKQAGRLVLQHMGEPFGKVLTKHRINAAGWLLETDKSLTLAEISQLVGFQSYSGFWKAMKAAHKTK